MISILTGDCLEILPTLEEKSVQCCVTSPPYWGLRDFGCNGQIGLEATPQEYIANMVRVFSEVWRVLKDDGTCWINIGDSYGANQGNVFDTHEKIQVCTPEQRARYQARKALQASPKVKTGLKPKDLCGIPWRLAFALQSDGWYLRSDIIWHKPNPIPESVTDRPTKSHESIFLMSKQERYYYDAEAIREPVGNDTHSRGNGTSPKHYRLPDSLVKSCLPFQAYQPENRNKRTVWTVSTQPYPDSHFATFPEDLIKPCILAGSKEGDTVLDPFAGTGTTGKVSIELGRNAILIELSPTYVTLAQDRTNVTPSLFNGANHAQRVEDCNSNLRIC